LSQAKRLRITGAPDFSHGLREAVSLFVERVAVCVNKDDAQRMVANFAKLAELLREPAVHR